MEVFRIREDGEIFRPHRDREGRYVLGDPRFGSKKHHKDNAVFAATLEEALRLVRSSGYSLRMKGERTGQVNLIAPSEIQVRS